MTESTTELSKRLVVGHKRDGRSCYDKGAKQELIERCLQPGVSVARMALQHGINANLLRTWITRYRHQGENPANRSNHGAAVLATRSAFAAVVASSTPVDLSGVCGDDLLSILQLLSKLPCSGSTAG